MSHRRPGPGGSWARRAPQPRPTRKDALLEAAQLLAAAREEGDPDKVAVMERFFDRLAEARQGEEMPTTTPHEDIIETLREGLARVGAERRAIDAKAETGEVLPAFAERERGRLRAEASRLDEQARDAIRADWDERATEARRLRARSEAQRDPAVRQADIAELQLMVSSATDASEYLRRADEMAELGQPRRAALYLDAARAKGAHPPADLVLAVEDGLDEAEPLRSQARAVEDAIEAESLGYSATRLGLLVDAGFGVTPTGDVGSGSPGEVATANTRAKVTAFANGERQFTEQS